ncbi:MAG: tetratricopeptide repeat protein [Phycisphaerales bacterium]|nr:tetratricopeptide repeat protein [Phycisphaerales bacterium]
MQRVCVTKILATCLLFCTAGCAARQDNGLMGYPKYRTRTAPGGTSRETPNQPPPQILPETYYAAGRVFEQQGAMDKAIEQYRKAVLLNHNYAAAYQRLGLVLSITDRHDEALEAFTKAVELKPESAVIRNNLGFELLYQERWAEAERHLREAVRINPKLARGHINLALLMARTERYDEALASFRQVLAEPDAYYNLGLVLRAQKRYEQAADAFNHVLSVNPEFTAARQQFAQIREKIEKVGQQDRETAAEPIEKATLAMIENEPSKTADAEGPTIVDEPAPPAISDERTPPLIAEQPKTAADGEQPTTVAEIPAKPVDEPNPVPVVTTDEKPIGATAQAATVPSPTTTIAGWTLTLADIARALDITDNDRECAKKEEARAEAEREAEANALTAGGETHETRTASMKLVGRPADETSDEVVPLLPMTESRESGEVPTKPANQVDATTRIYDRTWGMMRDLDVSLEIIRNEVDCRTRETGSADTAAMTERLFEKPAVFDERTEKTERSGDPCDEPDPAKRMFRWDESFGALETMLSVVRNEDDCIAYESMTARGRGGADAVAASLSLVPTPLMTINAVRMGPDHVADPCEPINEATARSIDRLGLRSPP